MATNYENMKNQLSEHLIEKPRVSSDYEQLVADIRRKKDDYSLIQKNYHGVVDIDEPTTVPFRWEKEDVGKEMVIVNGIGLFVSECIVELTLTSLHDDSVEFQIDQYTMIDTSSDDAAFKIVDQQEFEDECIVRIRRDDIITGDQLCRMSEFMYGYFGAPDHREFGLYALVQYWVHHNAFVKKLNDAAEMRAQAALDAEGQIPA